MGNNCYYPRAMAMTGVTTSLVGLTKDMLVPNSTGGLDEEKDSPYS